MTPLPIALAEFLESTEAVVAGATGLLVALGALALALYRASRWIRRQVEVIQLQSGETLHEVRNDHADNLRDDMDKKFETVHVKLDRITRSMDELQRSDSRQWQRTADLADKDDRIHNRLAAVENVVTEELQQQKVPDA